MRYLLIGIALLAITSCFAATGSDSPITLTISSYSTVAWSGTGFDLVPQFNNATGDAQAWQGWVAQSNVNAHVTMTVDYASTNPGTLTFDVDDVSGSHVKDVPAGEPGTTGNARILISGIDLDDAPNTYTGTATLTIAP